MGKVLPREQSNGVLNSVLKGGHFEPHQWPVYQVWDAIPLEYVKEKGKYLDPYRLRLARVISPLRNNKGDFISLIPTRICRSLEEAYKHYGGLLAKGKEGTIIKDPRAIWRDGNSREMCKLKLEVDVDLIAVDLLPGEGKNESTFGSILCRTSDCLLEVAVSGFTDNQRKEIHENWLETYAGAIMTVKANSVMKPQNLVDKYSLFLPRHVEFRSDKTEADSLQRVIDQFESAVKGEAATKKAA
jgi:DNA ligase-1